MEAVAVVGLASNILQFVEFTAKLIRISNELRNHRTWSTSRDHEIVTKHLKLLTQNISESAKVISQTSAMALPEEKALRLVADRCCELAKTLLSRLSKCGIQPGQNGGRLQRAKAILNGIWNKQEIEEIAHRLQFFRSELELHYTTQIRKTQLDQQIRQSTKEDLQLVLDRLDALESLISETVTSRHSEILKSIAAARIENARFESRAIQQSAASHSIITSRLDELECSIAATNMNVQNICARQSEVLESLAHVKVENREFLARITQQVPPTNHFGASFQHALKPLLEEYMGKFLAGVKKEYRGTARSEMDALLENTLPALGNIQYRTQPDPGNVADEIGLEVDQYNQTPNDPSSADEIASFASTDRRATSQLNKSELANIYHYCWGKKTSLGIFSLSIRDKVHLDESKHPTRLYELTVHFIPSPRWFSTGYSMTYHKSTDARGKPEFGLRLKTYRLLGEGHPVLEAIETNDILSLQSMLSQKLVSPSDQTPSGESLFHLAILYGHLDACKALVQSGADINALDIFGFGSIDIAVCAPYLYDHRERLDIFRYLLSLPGIEVESLWSNEFLIRMVSSAIADGHLEIEPECIDEFLQDWASACRSVDFDFNIPGEATFSTSILEKFSRPDPLPQEGNKRHFYLTTAFDSIVRNRIGVDKIVSVYAAQAASWIRFRLDRAYNDSLVTSEASSARAVFYRGYYVEPTVASSVIFLENVISKGILERPDCIFDRDDGITISDWFYFSNWRSIWEGILEDHGFDLDWVYEEDDRRKRMSTGESSAHQIGTEVDAFRGIEIRQRRGYDRLDE